MRRKDREITDIAEIIDVMNKCNVCRLGLNDNGYPYILPLNFGLEVNGDNITLYFHSALEGHKVELIQADNRASFEMDCDHELEYFEEKGYCTFVYESVMGKGHIRILDESEKLSALSKLMAHYHDGKEMPFDPAAVPRTLVYALDVEQITGKRKLRKGN